MFTDLFVTIVEGGTDPDLLKGIHPPYLYFTSKSLKLRTGYRRIIGGSCKGRVTIKKQPLFYFEYEEDRESCKVYPINEGVVSETFIIPECRIIMVD